jgi:hypothetical protein
LTFKALKKIHLVSHRVRILLGVMDYMTKLAV